MRERMREQMTETELAELWGPGDAEAKFQIAQADLAELWAACPDAPSAPTEQRKQSARDSERMSLGRDAVLPLQQATALLPMRDTAARAWLRSQCLVVQVGETPMVVWGAVLDRLTQALNTETLPPTDGRRRRQGLLPRAEIKI